MRVWEVVGALVSMVALVLSMMILMLGMLGVAAMTMSQGMELETVVIGVLVVIMGIGTMCMTIWLYRFGRQMSDYEE